MASGIFYVPDCEHWGDIDHFKNIIKENGGRIRKCSWSGSEDDEAIIIYECDNVITKNQIKEALENG